MTEVYLIERQEYDDAATVVAAYTDRALADMAVALDPDTYVTVMPVSVFRARIVSRLTLERAVLATPELVRFSLTTPLMKGETVERYDDIVSYGTTRTESEIRELHPYGWKASGDGAQATFLLVHASGLDHPAVRARFAELSRKAEAMAAQ